MTEALQIIDAENKPLLAGSKVDPGDGGAPGEVTHIEEGEEQGPLVWVHWSETVGDEYFHCHPRDFRREGPSGPYVWKCAELAVVDA